MHCNCPIALLVAGQLATLPAAGEEPVDFRRDIWPIFQDRCVACHGANKVKGGLRLDSRLALEQGGTLGQNLLQEPPATNDLLRRVSATDESERMPLEGEPLSAMQVKLIGLWLARGAPWPDQSPMSAPAAAPEPSRLDDLANVFGDTRPAIWAALGVLLGYLVVQQCRQQARQGAAAPPGTIVRRLAAVPRSLALVGLLACIVWGLALVMQQDRAELMRLKQQLARAHAARDSSPAMAPKQLAANHPPRLGGEYYRGNDERSPRLFNGGFYRTATLGLHLEDGDGNAMSWNDLFPAEPKIVLSIERAPKAAPALFSDRILSKTFLTAHSLPVREIDPTGAYQLLETVQAGESWRASYELPACSASERIRGELYLCTELKTGDNWLNGTPNYRIDYDLHIEGGQIDPRSRLALVSLVQPGNLLRPASGQILPDEWFDFRPIPVIEGEPATDPELLGIPEHVEPPESITPMSGAGQHP